MLPAVMVAMLLCAISAQAQQVDLNDVDAMAHAITGKWNADPAVLLKEMPGEINKAECVLTFQKGSPFNMTISFSGTADGIGLEMKISLDGTWSVEKGGTLKLSDLNPQLELTDIVLSEQMKEEMKSAGLTEATVKQMFNEMFNAKAKEMISLEDLKDLGETTIKSLTATTMIVKNEDDSLTLTKITE